MDKTIKINLGGTLFLIDEDAYHILHDYLKEIDARFRNIQGGYETIEDIEIRIAEIFLSQKGQAGVVTKENVEVMISVIGKPEDFDQFENDNSIPHFTSGRKGMYRNTDDSIMGGVCGGIGAYLGTDPVWIRILFILFAMFFGIGLFIYLALWIALPSDQTGSRKKEMYGNAWHSSIRKNSVPGKDTGIQGVGNALNEVFKALGRTFFIFLRIIFIITGTLLVLTGFIGIFSFVIVFLFRYPGSFSVAAEGINLSYIPDFLNFIVSPSVAPWITILVSIIVILPLLAFIYGGVKMIFWFRAREGIFSLSALVVWVMSIAALSIILFNEGIGYAERAKSISTDSLFNIPDTLYIKPINRISDLGYDHELVIPHKDFFVYINEGSKEVFIPMRIRIEASENNNNLVEITKQSSGRTRSEALAKANALQYSYRHSGDTLFLDEYFTYPSGAKWAFDDVGVTLHIPEGTMIYMGINTKNMIYPNQSHYYDRDGVNDDQGNRFWKLTKEGLKLE